jgi:hypothetical protein
MFGSNILEVAVGVVFVYLLLSLVCTIVNEGIASLVNQRGKILIAGIKNLLNDENLSGLAQQMYNHGLVVGVSENGSNPKKPNGLPSYMSPTGFALSLLDLLQAHGANIMDKQEKVAAAQDKPDLLQVATADLKKATDALSSTPQTGGAPTAVREALKISQKIAAGGDATEQILATGRELASKYKPLDRIEAAIGALPPSQMKDSLTVLLDKTKREVQLVEKDASSGEHYVQGLLQNVEHWFSDGMDRFAGWYKRWTQWLSLLVAAIVVVLANADTIKVAKSLLHDDTVRGAVVSAAESAIQSKDPNGEKALLQQAESLGLPFGWTATLDIDKKDAGTIFASCLMKIVGLGVSILAVSLGAPFWFDVLSKIVNVRATGKPPQEKQASSGKKAAAAA